MQITEERSVTFIVPALDEAPNLEGTIHDIQACCSASKVAWEILIIDDASRDETGSIANHLAAADSRIRVQHNATTRGMGYNFFAGAALATGDYLMLVPGDREIPQAAINAVLQALGTEDLIIPFPDPVQSMKRPFMRVIVSKTFVRLMNALFGLSLRYYNGPCLFRRNLIDQVRIRTNGFAFMASIVITLMKAGCTYKEVPIPVAQRIHGTSKALRLRNIAQVLTTIVRLRFS